MEDLQNGRKKTPVSAKDRLLDRFAGLTDGRERIFVWAMLSIVFLGFFFVLWTRKKVLDKGHRFDMETILPDSTKLRIKQRTLPLYGSGREELQNKLIKIEEYQQLLESGRLDSTQILRITEELNKMIEDEKNKP